MQVISREANKLTKYKILIFMRYYYPGYKAGGPITTLLNMSEHLKSEYDIYIITSSNDIDGETYDVSENKWLDLNGIMILYINKRKATIENLTKSIIDISPDLIIFK